MGGILYQVGWCVWLMVAALGIIGLFRPTKDILSTRMTAWCLIISAAVTSHPQVSKIFTLMLLVPLAFFMPAIMDTVRHFLTDVFYPTPTYVQIEDDWDEDDWDEDE